MLEGSGISDEHPGALTPRRIKHLRKMTRPRDNKTSAILWARSAARCSQAGAAHRAVPALRQPGAAGLAAAA